MRVTNKTATYATVCALICTALLTVPTEALNQTSVLHSYLLLDRSGSMHSIAADMVGSLNSYVSEQQSSELAPHGKLTLATFAGNDPLTLVHDAKNLSTVEAMKVGDFKPGGATPLFDAIAAVISHADRRAAVLHEVGAPEENVVVAVITDGAENASRRHARKEVSALVTQREQEKGWAFVFLGANIDAYEEGSQVGVSAKNTQNFAFDADGVQKAMRSLSRATTEYSAKIHMASEPGAVPQEPEGFFGGVKEAEVDFQSRGRHGEN